MKNLFKKIIVVALLCTSIGYGMFSVVSTKIPSDAEINFCSDFDRTQKNM